MVLTLSTRLSLHRQFCYIFHHTLSSLWNSFLICNFTEFFSLGSKDLLTLSVYQVRADSSLNFLLVNLLLSHCCIRLLLVFSSHSCLGGWQKGSNLAMGFLKYRKAFYWVAVMSCLLCLQKILGATPYIKWGSNSISNRYGISQSILSNMYFLAFNPRNCRRQEDHKSCNYCSIKQIVRFQRN